MDTRRRGFARVVAPVLGLSLAIVMTGCGTAYSGGGAATGKGSLEVWASWAQGTPQQKIYADAFKAFEKKTGITVDVKFMGDEMVTSAQQALPTGSGPDVLSLTGDSIKTLPGLADVTDVYRMKTDDGAVLGDKIPTQLTELSSVKGARMLVPNVMTGYSLWYDAAVDPEIASKPPVTWDDFIAQLDALKAKGRGGIALDGTNPNHVSRWFYWPLLREAGAGSFAALATTKDGSAWDDPAVLKAAQASAQLASGGYFLDGYQGSKFPNQQNAWASGQAGFLLNGSWVPQETASAIKPGAQLRPMPFPTMPGGKGDSVVELGVLGWGMSAKSEHKDEAKQLLAYLGSSDIAEELATKAASIPARSDVKVSDELAPYMKWVKSADEVTPAFDGAISAAGNWWADVLTPLTSQLVFGTLTPEQFVEQGKKRTTEFWATQG